MITSVITTKEMVTPAIDEATTTTAIETPAMYGAKKRPNYNYQ